MNPVNKLIALFDRIEDSLALLGGLLIVFAMVAVTVDVTSRFAFNRPIGWVFEVTEFILLVVPMIGGAWLLKTDGHVNIDTVLNYMSEKAASFLGIVTSVIGAGTCLFTTYWGASTTWSYYQRGVMTSGIVRFPKFVILAFIPIGFAFISIEFLRKIVVYHRRWKAPSKETASVQGEEASGF